MPSERQASQAKSTERFGGYSRLPIEVGPLLLRRTAYEDHDDFCELLSQPEVHQFDYDEPWTAENVAWMLQQQTTIRIGDPGVDLRFAVIVRSDCKVIGNCLLHITDILNHTAEFGIALNRGFWDRRYGALATHAALGFGFGRMGLHRIFAATDPQNERCWKMLERVGMRREGHHKQWRKMKGDWIDDYIYAMLAEEWNPSTGNEIAAEVPPE